MEAYVGEYASGKSEVAVNRAICLHNSGKEVTLADLDLVEPFYTLRPIRKQLIEMGINVIAWETGETLGLGETGNVIMPELRWILRRPGDIIMDIGYGVEGIKVLNLVEGSSEEKNLHIYVVLNIGRPMTAAVDDIVEYIKTLGTVHGLINNSHLGDDTYVEFVQEGARIITESARVLNLPVVATYIDNRFKGAIGPKDCMDNPVKFLNRYMTQAFW